MIDIKKENEKLSIYQMWIGKKVTKNSGKPFKSGNKIGTPKGIVEHPHTKILAFTFEEDDSLVECRRCA